MAGTVAGARKAWRARRQHTAAVREQRQKTSRIFKAAMELADRQSQRGYVSGLEISLQKIDEEYVPELRELGTRLGIYQKMGNDAKVAAQLRANILPLISAVRWKVEGGTPEMRDLVEQNILRKGDPRYWCETSWTQRLLEKLQCLHYGFALHGKTVEVVDGYRIFRRLTYLHPKSLGGPLGPWEWDKSGTRLVALHRAYNRPDGTRETDERIPIEEIDAAVWWMTGENWEGSPLIRPMFGSWKKKDLASKIAMIALLNGGVGIPMATMGEADGPKDRDQLKTIAGDLRQGSKERQFIVLKDGQKMEFLTTNGTIVDAGPVINEQNMDIAAAGATDFMQMGQTASGSRASGSVLMVSYMQQLDAVREWLQEQINHGAGYLRGIVEELIYDNFTDVKECPQIVGSRVSPTEQLDNVPNILDAVQKGGLVHDLNVENHVRKALGVKELSPAEFDVAQKAMQPVSIGGRPNEVGDADREDPRDDKASRAFGLVEKKTPDGYPPMKNPASYPWQRSSRA